MAGEIKRLATIASKKLFLAQFKSNSREKYKAPEQVKTDLLVSAVVSSFGDRLTAAGFLSLQGVNTTTETKQGATLLVGFLSKADDLLDKGIVRPNQDIDAFRNTMLSQEAFAFGEETISMGDFLNHIETALLPNKKKVIDDFLTNQLKVHAEFPTIRKAGTYSQEDVEEYRRLTNIPYILLISDIFEADLATGRNRRGQVVDRRKRAIANAMLAQHLNDISGLIKDYKEDQLNYILGLAYTTGEYQKLKAALDETIEHESNSKLGKIQQIREIMKSAPLTSTSYRDILELTLDETSTSSLVRKGLRKLLHYLIP